MIWSTVEKRLGSFQGDSSQGTSSSKKQMVEVRSPPEQKDRFKAENDFATCLDDPGIGYDRSRNWRWPRGCRNSLDQVGPTSYHLAGLIPSSFFTPLAFIHSKIFCCAHRTAIRHCPWKDVIIFLIAYRSSSSRLIQGKFYCLGMRVRASDQFFWGINEDDLVADQLVVKKISPSTWDHHLLLCITTRGKSSCFSFLYYEFMIWSSNLDIFFFFL